VALSGGGRGPLAVLNSPAGGRLAIWFPLTLPAPVVRGSTATYRSIRPGVTLQATVSPVGQPAGGTGARPGTRPG